jgi:uncharacterized protein
MKRQQLSAQCVDARAAKGHLLACALLAVQLSMACGKASPVAHPGGAAERRVTQKPPASTASKSPEDDLGTCQLPAAAEDETAPLPFSDHLRACEAGNAESCDDAATLLRRRSSASPDIAQAVSLYRRACSGGSAAGCANLALRYRSGDGVAVDYDEAKRLYGIACARGFAHGCAGMGDMFEHQVEWGRDSEKAAEYYDKACRLGSSVGCAALGELYEKGHGVPATLERAVRLYTTSCVCGSSYGCLNAARLAEQEASVKLADALYGIAAKLNRTECDSGDPYYCSLLGDQYRDGHGVPKDPKRAAELYEYGCRNHMTAGCDGLRSLRDQAKGAQRPDD